MNPSTPIDAAASDGRWSYFFRLGVRLRWRLMRNRLRKGGTVMFVITVTVASLGALAGFATFALARLADDPLQREATAIAGVGSILLGWIILPLMSGGSDETLDPTRLALLPLSRRQLGAVMTGAAVSGPATIAVFVACCGLAIGYGRLGPGLLVAVLAVPVTFLLGLGLSRLFSALLARAVRSRGGRDVAVLIAALLAATIWLGTQAIGPALERADRSTVRRLIDALSWPPTGWPGRALFAASEGQTARAVLWLAASALVAAAALAGWARVTARMLQTSERVMGERANSATAPLGGASSEWRAALAREWRYLRRSPGRRAQMVMTTVMDVGFAMVQVFRTSGDRDPRIVFVGLGAMVFAIGPAFNVIGFDSGSLWLEDMTGGITVARLRARSLGCLAHALLPGALGVFAISAFAGKWSDTLLALACLPGLALGGLGVGALSSTITPLPAADGDNPFAWRAGTTGKGCTQAIWMIGGLLAMVVISLPSVLPAAIFDDRWWAYPLALVGLALGILVFLAGTARGARRLAGRGPDLIAELSPRALT